MCSYYTTGLPRHLLKNCPGKLLNCLLGRGGGEIKGKNEEAQGTADRERCFQRRELDPYKAQSGRSSAWRWNSPNGRQGGSGRPSLEDDGALAHRSASLGSQVRYAFFVYLLPPRFLGEAQSPSVLGSLPGNQVGRVRDRILAAFRTVRPPTSGFGVPGSTPGRPPPTPTRGP